MNGLIDRVRDEVQRLTEMVLAGDMLVVPRLNALTMVAQLQVIEDMAMNLETIAMRVSRLEAVATEPQFPSMR